MDAEIHDDAEIARKLLCQRVERIPLTHTETLFIDEEGFGRPDVWGKVFFTFTGIETPMPGCGLVLGVGEDGRWADTAHTVESVAEAVTFPDIELVGFKTVEDKAELFGGVFTQQSTQPVFRQRSRP